MDFIHPFTDRSFFLIAGPCVIESRDHTHYLAAQLQGRHDRLETITAVLTELEGKARQALDLAKTVPH